MSKDRKLIQDRIPNLVDTAFRGEDKEQILIYIDWIRSTISDYRQEMRRNGALLLILIAAFELVLESRNATLQIGTFALTRGSLVLVFVPAIVSYLIYQIMLDMKKLDRLIVALHVAVRKWNPKTAQVNLHAILDGPQPAYLSVPSLTGNLKYRFDDYESYSATIVAFAVMSGTLAFTGQAYYVLFPTHVSTIAAWAISLCITIYFLVVGAIQIGAGDGLVD